MATDDMDSAAASPHRYHVVLNAHAGTATTLGLTEDVLARRFAEQGLVATIDARTDLPLDERIQAALRTNADVIVAAGGDGTVTALADVLVGTERMLAILPLGTANMLARDLAIPLDITQWMAQLAAMQPHRIDVGRVNGRHFLHKVVIGLIPAIAAGRERVRGRRTIGAFVGFSRYFLRRLIRARRLAVEITPRGAAPHIERVQSVAIANNRYAEGVGQFFARPELDRGHLTLYVVKHLNFGDMLRLTTEMLLGNWQEDEALTIDVVEAVRIRTRNRLVKVMLDGEIMTLHSPLEFALLPRALSILTPPPVAQDAPRSTVAVA